MFGKTNLFGKLMGHTPKRRRTEIMKAFEEYDTDPLRRAMFTELCIQDDAFYFAQRKNVTKLFDDFMVRRILRPSNLIIMIEGPQGEGKSYIALWLAWYWVCRMNELTHRHIQIHFTFNSAESQNMLSTVGDGDMIMQDEDSKLIGRGAGTAESELTNLVETMRYTQKSIIICAPHLKMLPGMVTALRPYGQLTTTNPDEFQTKVLLFQLKEGKPSDTNFMLLGYVVADIFAIPEDLLIKYKAAKDANYRQLELNSGAAGAQSKAELAKLTKHAKKILKVALKHHWPRDPSNPAKNALTLYFMEAGVKVSRDQEAEVKQLVVDLFLEKHAKQKVPPPSSLPDPAAAGSGVSPQVFFTAEDDAILAEIKAANPTDPNIDRDIDIYLASKDPLKTAEDYAQKYHISPTRVGQIKAIMKGKLSERTGNKYEAFLEPFLQQKYATVIHQGGVGHPDFICIDSSGHYFIYSVKCYRIGSRGSYSLKWDESHAEIEYARELFRLQKIQAVVITHLFNLDSQKIHEFSISDPKVITTQAPYVSRTFVVKKGEFTRDPAVASWV
jgi:hypothetical protein